MQLVSNDMFVSSYRLHLRSSRYKGTRPIRPPSLITLIVVVQNILMVSWCKLQKQKTVYVTISMVEQNPQKEKLWKNEKRMLVQKRP